MKTVRFGVSLDQDLLDRFDEFIARKGYPTRSEALKNLMGEALVNDEWTRGEFVAGSVAFAYDHHKPGMVDKLLSVQHDFGEEIVCSQHAHLTHELCMETIVVRGSAAKISAFVNSLRQIKGLLNIALTVVCTDEHDRVHEHSYEHAHVHVHAHDGEHSHEHSHEHARDGEHSHEHARD